MRNGRGFVRRAAISAILLGTASCSGGDEPDAVSTPESTSERTSASSSLPGDVPPQAGSASPPPDGFDPAVVVDASIDGEVVRLEGDLTEAADPFGDFASCSGARDVFTTYALVTSRTTGDLRSLTVATDEPVAEPGIHDATIHVELADGTSVDAVGTMTLEAGFRSGTFTAFTDAGALLDGTFECGAGRDPVPLSLGDDDGRLDTVDAVALLRRGQFERLVGFAVTADDAEVQCPAAESTAPATDVVVRVAGDASIGAVTEFGLTGGAAPALDLRVGASDYRFTDVTITVEGATGTFSGSADGVTVDGAYRCT